MSENRTLLEQTTGQLLRDMYLEKPSQEGYDQETKRLASLYELSIKEEQAQKELELKEQQLKQGRSDLWWKVLIDGALVVLPIIFNWIWMTRGFKFEETGSFTSTTFKNLFNRFRIGK